MIFFRLLERSDFSHLERQKHKIQEEILGKGILKRKQREVAVVKLHQNQKAATQMWCVDVSNHTRHCKAS